MDKNNPASFLPEDKLPECWKDEARVNVLYAPFRNRTVNPKDFETKLEFWKNMIEVYCDHYKLYSFTIDDLRTSFKRDGRSPAGLEVVVGELFKNGELKTLDEYLQKSSESWSGWAADVLIKRPMLWSFKKLKNTLISDNINQVYVHVPTVRLHASALYKIVLEDQKHKLSDMNELMAFNKYNENELKLLLHCLLVQGNVSIRELKSNDSEIGSTILIKFGDIKKIRAISDLEVDVYMLEQSEKTLTKNIQNSEIESADILLETKSYLLKGHKQTAKSCLRKKHELEKRIAKMADALFNVQTLLSRVQDATMNAKVLDTYKAALSSLRQTFKENGLTEDNVTTTMLEIGEVLDIHDDIQNTMAQPLTDSDVDLEEELAQLLNSNEHGNSPSNGPKEKPIKDDLLDSLKKLDMNLPDVPRADPNVNEIGFAI